MIGPYQEKRPRIAATAFIEESACIIGDVEIGEHSSIWFYSVVRGDVDSIRIGAYSNIQDHCTLHVENNRYPLVIEDRVTVGHGVVLHGCHIRSECLIGIHATVLNNSVVGENCIIAAGALVPENANIPAGSLVMGIPGKVVRPVTPEEMERIRRSAQNYFHYKEQYLKDGYGTRN